MDDLIQAAQERRLSQLMRLAPVRAAIDERLNRLRSDLATRAIGRKLADLRGAFEQIAAEEAERALADEFSTFDPGQRDLLQRFASTVARRLAHLPLAGMRAAAAHASTDAVDAFFREAKLRRSGKGDTNWTADPDAIDATGHQVRLDEDELSAAGRRWRPDPAATDSVGGWKPDDVVSNATGWQARPGPDALDVHGRGWKPDSDAVDLPAPDDALRAEKRDVTSSARKFGGGRRGVEPSDAGALVADAAPTRTSWAKD
jgi:hypothetical protein